jgi:hypothetical protein
MMRKALIALTAAALLATAASAAPLTYAAGATEARRTGGVLTTHVGVPPVEGFTPGLVAYERRLAGYEHGDIVESQWVVLPDGGTTHLVKRLLRNGKWTEPNAAHFAAAAAKAAPAPVGAGATAVVSGTPVPLTTCVGGQCGQPRPGTVLPNYVLPNFTPFGGALRPTCGPGGCPAR